MAEAETAPALNELLADERITALGLIIESSSALMDEVTRDLNRRGVTLSAWEIMIRLSRSPGRRLRLSELAGQSTLTNSGLSRLIDRLCDLELVVREPSKDDKRGYYAVLTDRGYQTALDLVPDHLKTIDRLIIDVLTPEELEGLLVACRKLRDATRPPVGK